MTSAQEAVKRMHRTMISMFGGFGMVHTEASLMRHCNINGGSPWRRSSGETEEPCNAIYQSVRRGLDLQTLRHLDDFLGLGLLVSAQIGWLHLLGRFVEQF
jgi:hypothetical protein